MRYKCVVELCLNDYDEDGFATGGYSVVPIGSIWEVDNESPKIVGNDDTVRLVSGSKWIEILGSTLSAYFEELKEMAVSRMSYEEIMTMIKEACNKCFFYGATKENHNEIIKSTTKIYIEQMKLEAGEQKNQCP